VFSFFSAPEDHFGFITNLRSGYGYRLSYDAFRAAAYFCTGILLYPDQKSESDAFGPKKSPKSAKDLCPLYTTLLDDYSHYSTTTVLLRLQFLYAVCMSRAV